MWEFTGKGVMGMDDGLSDLADLSDLSWRALCCMLDPTVEGISALRMRSILISLSNHAFSVPQGRLDRKGS